jgi:hypothetical protein
MDYPKSVPGVGLVGGKFIDENVQTGQQGSLIPAAWGNAVTDEILAVIAGAGLTPDESAYDQLLEAIETLIASGAVTYENSAAVLLADGVASAGARNTAARGDHRHPTDTSREPARTQATQAEMEAMAREMKRRILEINSADPTAVFGLYVDDLRCRIGYDWFVAQGIDSARVKVSMLSDGTGTYNNFYNYFGDAATAEQN